MKEKYIIFDNELPKIEISTIAEFRISAHDLQNCCFGFAYNNIYFSAISFPMYL